MSKTIQCTVGLIAVLALVLALLGFVLLVLAFAPWLIFVGISGGILFLLKDDVCLLGETILTLVKAIWSKP